MTALSPRCEVCGDPLLTTRQLCPVCIQIEQEANDYWRDHALRVAQQGPHPRVTR